MNTTSVPLAALAVMALALARPPALAGPPAVRVLGRTDYQAPGRVSNVAFSADSKLLAAVCEKQVVVWDLATRAVVHRFPCHGFGFDVTFRGSDRLLAVVQESSFDGGEGDGDLLAEWDLRTNARTWTKRLPENGLNVLRVLALSPDARHAFVGQEWRDRDEWYELLVYDLQAGGLAKRLVQAARPWTANTYTVNAIGVSKDGRLVATIDSCTGWRGGTPEPHDPQARAHGMIWDWAASTCLHEWELPDGYRFAHGPIRWLDGDQHLLFPCVSPTLKGPASVLVNARTGDVVREWRGGVTVDAAERSLVHVHARRLRVVDYASDAERFAMPLSENAQPRLSPDGRWLASGAGKAVLLVDMENRRQIAPGDGHTSGPYWFWFNPDGKLLVHDGRLNVYDDADGRRLARLKAGLYCVGCNAEAAATGRLVLSGGGNGRAEIWDVARGTLLGRLGPAGAGVQSLALSADGSLAVTIGESGILKGHDVRTGAELYALTGMKHSSFGAVCDVAGIVFSPHTGRLFIADESAGWFSGDRQGHPVPAGLSGAFEARTGRRLYWFRDAAGEPIEVVREVVLDEEDDMVFVRRQDPAAGVTVCRASDGAFLRTIDSPGAGFVLTPDRRRVVGSRASVDLATGATLRTFTTAGSVSPGGTFLATVDDTRTLRVLDTATGRQVVSRDLAAAAPEATQPGTIAWHPAETQVAVSFRDSPIVLQVDLVERAAKGDVSAASLLDADAAAADGAPQVAWLRARVVAVRNLRAANDAAQPLPGLPPDPPPRP